MRMRIYCKLLFALLLCSLSQMTNAQVSNRWKATAGMGLARVVGGDYKCGYSDLFQLSYSIKSLELGASIQHTSFHDYQGDGFSYSNVLFNGANATPLMGGLLGTSNVTIFDLYAGVNVVNLFKKECKHSFTVSLFAGILISESAFLSIDSSGASLTIFYGPYWSYGAKGTYEYMFTDRIGAGTTISYDAASFLLSLYANLNIHF